MDFAYTEKQLETLLNTFTDLTVIPKQYSLNLEPFFKLVALNCRLRQVALQICKSKFDLWDRSEENLGDPEIILRCIDLWFIVQREEYELKRPLPVTNVVTEVVEVTDYVTFDQLERLEFDSQTGGQIFEPLRNLIVEEVEIKNFVNSEGDGKGK